MASSNNGGGPTGRSPFVGRNRRRISHGTDTNNTSTSAAAAAGEDTNSNSTSLSMSTPGLLSAGGRLSPAAAAGWSPRNAAAGGGAGTTSSTTATGRRFFDSSSKHGSGGSKGSGTGVLQDGGVLVTAIPPPSTQKSTTNRTNNTMNNRSGDNGNNTGEDPSNNNNDMNNGPDEQEQPQPPMIVDGMDLTQLRSIAIEAQGNHSVTASPSMAVFYASMLYAKTLHIEDAFLYAKSLFQNGEARRCVRLLEKAGLIASQNAAASNIEAVLLASQALASLSEWEEVLRILEDCTSPLEDDDHAGWDSLSASVVADKSSASSSESSIHPVARLCVMRGRAYNETGHPTRSATFWKRALMIDARCVEALDSLLGRNVMTPQEAYELVIELQFDDGIQWLRHIYLARLDLPQDTIQKENKEPNITTTMNNTNTKNQNSFFDADASSIHMTTPHIVQQTTTTTSNSIFGDNNNNIFGGVEKQADDQKLPAAAAKSSSVAGTPSATTTSGMKKKKNAICKDVDTAFDKLWTEHKLHQSPELLSLAAIRAYRRYNLPAALSYCQALAAMDPLNPSASFVHVATLVGLGHKRLLFGLAHEWVDAAPKSAQAWFAVGSYYYACGRYHVAQRHYCRATRLDPHCPEAWIAFGCAFAASDESDQALASFRAAQRLAPAQHSSMLYMGMEYLRTNHLVLAQHFLSAALQSSGGDPLCLHELGVAAFNKKEYDVAINYFGKALRTSVETSRQTQTVGKQQQLQSPATIQVSTTSSSSSKTTTECIDMCQDDFWEPTLFNLGQCYRKTRKFAQAAHCFEKCLVLCPGRASSYAALGFTKHLMGDLDGAVELYHQALSRKPDDPFSSEMLNRALQESLESFTLHDENQINNNNNNIMSSASSSKHNDSSTSFNLSNTMMSNLFSPSPQTSRSGGAGSGAMSSFLSPDGSMISSSSRGNHFQSGVNSARRHGGGGGGRDMSMNTDGSNLSLASGGDIDMSMTMG